jgi:hypothetical protein
MTRENLSIILSFFVALLPAMLWALLLAPLLLRALGVPVPLKWRDRKHLQLSLPQSILSGVIGWGFAMIIAQMTNTYVEWMLYRSPLDQPTLWRFSKAILIWTIGGVVFGLLTFTTYPKEKQNEE